MANPNAVFQPAARLSVNPTTFASATIINAAALTSLQMVTVMSITIPRAQLVSGRVFELFASVEFAATTESVGYYIVCNIGGADLAVSAPPPAATFRRSNVSRGSLTVEGNNLIVSLGGTTSFASASGSGSNGMFGAFVMSGADVTILINVAPSVAVASATITRKPSFVRQIM